MGSTGTPTKLGASAGPVNGWLKGKMTIIPASITMSASYATGGDTVTLPTDAKGMQLAGLVIQNPLGRTAGGTRVFSWDGSLTTPKIHAMVMSTGAQVASTTDLSAITLDVLFIFET